MRILILLTFLTLFIVPCIGDVIYSPASIFSDGVDGWILLNLRFPRVLMGLIVGCTLSVSGVVMQNVFRNPLAEPYILGVSTGAGLGAMIGFVLGIDFRLIPILTFCTSILTVFTVYKLAGSLNVESLLLCGIAVNIFLYALEWLILIKTNAHMILGWLVGYLGDVLWRDVEVAVFALIPTTLTYAYSKQMNAILLGEESAFYLGVDVGKVLKILIVLSTLATSITVSFVGIVGFVGLMIPHIARRIYGDDNRLLIPASALIGSVFLTWMDAIARILKVPVGIITMLCGGPFFIYVFKRPNSR
ncbi:MAG: iron ABC transporter permease [Archaeoglobales archaeon]|nr:MAG: iron ABC transporter permease [Archaeoglobales archaeon]